MPERWRECVRVKLEKKASPKLLPAVQFWLACLYRHGFFHVKAESISLMRCVSMRHSPQRYTPNVPFSVHTHRPLSHTFTIQHPAHSSYNLPRLCRGFARSLNSKSNVVTVRTDSRTLFRVHSFLHTLHALSCCCCCSVRVVVLVPQSCWKTMSGQQSVFHQNLCKSQQIQQNNNKYLQESIKGREKEVLVISCLPPSWLFLVIAAGSVPGRQECRGHAASLRRPSSSLMVVLSLAVLRFVLVMRSSRLWATAPFLPPPPHGLFWAPAFGAMRFLPSLFRGCRRSASSLWSPCHLRRYCILLQVCKGWREEVSRKSGNSKDQAAAQMVQENVCSTDDKAMYTQASMASRSRDTPEQTVSFLYTVPANDLLSLT